MVRGSRLQRSCSWLVVILVLVAVSGCRSGGGAQSTPTPQPTTSAAPPTVAPSASEPTAIDLQYRFTDLGVLGGLDSAARAVSATGVVVGHADTEPNSEWQGFHAFWWPPMAGTMVDLGTVGDDGRSSAEDVNGVNQIVGASLAADGRTHAFLWDGDMHDLGNLGEERAEANAINESGQIVGASAPAPGGDHAFLWTPDEPNAATGTMTDLGTLPKHVAAYALDVNDVGQVVGYSNDPEWLSHPFLWMPAAPNAASGTMIELPYLPGAEHGVAEAINADGWVVGSMEVSSPVATERAFLWKPDEANGTSGSMIELGTLGGDHSFAYGINAAGDVVGYAQLPADGGWPGVDHAFLYRDGAMVDLNSLLVAGSPDIELMIAEGIGDDGSIVGTAIVEGHRHGFLLTPVPDGTGD